MRYTKQVEVGAPAAPVWAVLVDVERWPSWTPTVTALELLGSADERLGAGDRVRITQPGLRPTTYTVTDVDHRRRWFAWEARRPGLRQRADHEVEAVGEERARVTLTCVVDGPLGALLSLVAASTVRRMVDAEAEALRRRVEDGGVPDGGVPDGGVPDGSRDQGA